MIPYKDADYFKGGGRSCTSLSGIPGSKKYALNFRSKISKMTKKNNFAMDFEAVHLHVFTIHPISTLVHALKIKEKIIARQNSWTVGI